MLENGSALDEEVLVLAAKANHVFWKWGITSGLVAISAYWVLCSKRARAGGVTPQRHRGTDAQNADSAKPTREKAVKSVPDPGLMASGARSLGSFDPPAGVSVPEAVDSVPATLPIRLARLRKRTDLIAVVCLGLLLLTTLYNATQLFRIDRSTDRLVSGKLPASSSVTEQSIPMEQQAWIGVSVPQTLPLTADGGGFGVELRNSGKTPGLQTMLTDYVLIEELDRLSGAQEAASYRPVAVGTLMPGSGFSTDVRFKTNAEGIHSLLSAKVRVVNYALVTYDDVFHHKHTTRSCFYWHAGLLAPLPCEDFNQAE